MKPIRTHTFGGRRYVVEAEHTIQGWCDLPEERDTHTIYVDPALPPSRHIEVCIHEALHALREGWTEDQVDSLSVPLARWLWRMGYRRG